MKHISIETNPTSNYRIGDFERYDEHPILYFFNYGLEHEDIAPHSITVSIITENSRSKDVEKTPLSSVLIETVIE